MSRDDPDWLARAAKVVLLFALLGPPLGAVFMVTGLTLLLGCPSKGCEDLAGDYVLMLIVGAHLSYFIGGLPALVVGLLVVICGTYLKRVPFWLAIVTPILLMLGWRFLTIGFDLSINSDFVILTATAVGASAACWRISKRWHSPNA